MGEIQVRSFENNHSALWNEGNQNERWYALRYSTGKAFSDVIHFRKRQNFHRRNFSTYPHFFLAENLLGSGSISKVVWLEVGGASCPVCPPVATLLVASATVGDCEARANALRKIGVAGTSTKIIAFCRMEVKKIKLRIWCSPNKLWVKFEDFSVQLVLGMSAESIDF